MIFQSGDSKSLRGWSGPLQKILFVFILMVPISAFASSGAASTASRFTPGWYTQSCDFASSNQPNLICSIGSIVFNYNRDFEHVGYAMANHMTGYGFMMLRGFLLIALMMTGLKMLLSPKSGEAEIQNLIMKIIWWATVFLIVHQYGWIYSSFVNILNELGSGLADSISVFHGSHTAINTPIGSAADVIFQLMNLYHKFKGFTFSDFFKGAFYNSVMNLLVLTVMMCLVAVGLFIIGVTYIIYSFKYFYSIAISIALGPIVLPTLMFRWTRETFFDGWYQFTWTSLVFKLVGPLMLGLVNVLFISPITNYSYKYAIYTFTGNGAHNVTNLHVNYTSFWITLMMLVITFNMMRQLDSFVGNLGKGAAIPDGFSGGLGSVPGLRMIGLGG